MLRASRIVKEGAAKTSRLPPRGGRDAKPFEVVGGDGPAFLTGIGKGRPHFFPWS
jgi:hypothetical protein